jgi:hypothetical protein
MRIHRPVVFGLTTVVAALTLDSLFSDITWPQVWILIACAMGYVMAFTYKSRGPWSPTEKIIRLLTIGGYDPTPRPFVWWSVFNFRDHHPFQEFFRCLAIGVSVWVVTIHIAGTPLGSGPGLSFTWASFAIIVFFLGLRPAYYAAASSAWGAPGYYGVVAAEAAFLVHGELKQHAEKERKAQAKALAAVLKETGQTLSPLR